MNRTLSRIPRQNQPTSTCGLFGQTILNGLAQCSRNRREALTNNGWRIFLGCLACCKTMFEVEIAQMRIIARTVTKVRFKWKAFPYPSIANEFEEFRN